MSTTSHAYSAENELDFYETPDWAPPALLRALLRDGYDYLRAGRILDPFAGRGAILRAVRAELPRAEVMGIEIDPGRSCVAGKIGPVWTRDALAPEPWLTSASQLPSVFDMVLTNPPYNRTMDCVERTLREGRGPSRPPAEPLLVAHLLAMQFLSSADRAPFHLKHPSRVYVLSRRPSFCATLKCKNSGKTGTGKACTFKKQQPLEDERPKACPLCGAKVDVTTNDSATYAWFVWGVLPKHEHTWTVIPSEQCR